MLHASSVRIREGFVAVLNARRTSPTGRSSSGGERSDGIGDGFTNTGIVILLMSSPLSETRHSQQMRDALFITGSITGLLFVSGVLGYGNFATTLPGLVLLVVAGYLGFRLSRR